MPSNDNPTYTQSCLCQNKPGLPIIPKLGVKNAYLTVIVSMQNAHYIISKLY